MTVKQAVAVWGFPSEALHGWPEDFELQPVISLPTDKLLFVHNNKAEAFQEQVEEELHAKGLVQDAVLYLTDEGEVPEEAWMYFETTVEAEDWDAIGELVACPQLVKMADWAEKVPLSQIDDILKTRNLSHSALPSELSTHLTTCESCRRAFVQTLSERQLSHYQLLCPPVERLAAWSWNQVDDPWVAAHLDGCSACRAEVATLKKLVAVPVILPILFQVPLSLWARVNAGLQTQLEEIKKGLATWPDRLSESLAPLTQTFLQSGMQLAGAGGVRSSSGLMGAQSQEPPPKIENLTVSNDDLDFVLSWSEEDEVVWIERLSDEWGEEFEYFELEIQQEGKTLWRTESQEGRAVIPLAELEAALKNEATLVIRAQKPDDDEEEE